MARRRFNRKTPLALRAFTSSGSTLPPIGERFAAGQTSGLGARFAGGPTPMFKQRGPIRRSSTILSRAASTGRSTQRGLKAAVRHGRQVRKFGGQVVQTGRTAVSAGRQASAVLKSQVSKVRQRRSKNIYGKKTKPFRTNVTKELPKTVQIKGKVVKLKNNNGSNGLNSNKKPTPKPLNKR